MTTISLADAFPRAIANPRYIIAQILSISIAIRENHQAKAL